MQLERQLKIALDENRFLILGAQVLFGFQFNGIFQEKFKELPSFSRVLICAGLPLLVIAVALLTGPSMQHRPRHLRRGRAGAAIRCRRRRCHFCRAGSSWGLVRLSPVAAHKGSLRP
jgi:hypothetical protein